MYISRLLVLPLLVSLWVAPVAAQSSADWSQAPQSLPALPMNTQASIRADQFHLLAQSGASNLSYSFAPPELGAHVLAPRSSDVTCYSIRSYRVKRDDPESDSTRPAGYSTCQPRARFQVKDAGDWLEIEPSPIDQP